MKKTVIFLFLLLLAVSGWLWLSHQKPEQNQNHPSNAHSFNKTQYSTSDPGSPWVVVNKLRPLNPISYQPDDLTNPNIPLRLDAASEEMHLRKDAAAALQELAAAASKQDVKFMLASGYRSYDFQVDLYHSYVDQQGQAEADKQSARAGYSEHQTGLAADLEPTSRKCEVEECFADTTEGAWLAEHAYQYGFLIRYPKDGQKITGYMYEPWHVRYIGKPLAREMHNKNIATLEEFFGLPAAPTYR